jgi:hypothetical protein
VFTEELTNCDGSLYDTFMSTICTVPISKLTATPFNLVQGNHVDVKVISYNTYGDSVTASPLGNGATIVLVPDAPLNLANVPAVTNAY